MEDNSQHQVKKDYRQKPTMNKAVFLLIFAVLIASVSFYEGMQYQKHHGTSTAANTTSSSSQSSGGGFGGSRGGTFADRVIGQVTAISATSISVQNSRTGATNTLAITSSTQISDNGQTATTSDIQTGDTVFVTEDSSNTSQAARILVNPSFGGGANNSPQSPSSTGTTATPAVGSD
jgi:hypothetical protein